MLKIFDSTDGLSLHQMVQIYSGSMHAYEQRAYEAYLCNEFFTVRGALCAVWEDAGAYVCALRLEPFKDGLLVTGLETMPAQRRKGFAGRLLSGVIQYLKDTGPVNLYSHIERKNIPSIRVHTSCGFSLHLDCAVFLDGSASRNYNTYLLQV